MARGRVHKRAISDQQKRRELALKRQRESRSDSQDHARRLASALLSSSEVGQSAAEDFCQQNVQEAALGNPGSPIGDEDQTMAGEQERASARGSKRFDNLGLLAATKLKGERARQWFCRQFMMPEWMVDIPPRLKQEWYVMPRPAGKRCLVVSSNGTTVSRLRNGRILHYFPSALPSGARIKNAIAASHEFCILDCIFHEPDQTYYVVDMICWRGYSVVNCSAEFRFYWLSYKLAETGACNPPSTYHKYQFSVVRPYDCDRPGLQAAYNGSLPYIRDGLLFCNRHAHYVLGLTPLTLLWKDENCSQYVKDTDKKGLVPMQQQVVLELQEDGTTGTADDPPVILGTAPEEFLQQHERHLRHGILVRFAIADQGLHIVDGKIVAADLQFQGMASRSRALADSCSKVLFQYAARHCPLTIQDLSMSIDSSDEEEDVVMAD